MVIAVASTTDPREALVDAMLPVVPDLPGVIGDATTAAVFAATWAERANDTDTCILSTQLGNPTSNAIYRAIGYQPVGEIVRYRFTLRA